MPERSELPNIPLSREPVSLLAVDRAVAELRRGHMVVIAAAHGRAALALAAEAATESSLDTLARRAQSRPVLVLTGRRAKVLGLGGDNQRVVTLAAAAFDAALVRDLADPLSATDARAFNFAIGEPSAFGCETAAVALTKLARLLPAALVAPLASADSGDLAAWAARHGLLMVDAGDVFQYDAISARTLAKVSEARVPLPGAENTRVIAFRPRDGGLEHLALVIGDPDPARPVLVRIHSECFTGDLLGSLRCDCGDQLRGAIGEIARAGGGALLYLAQEGRGIGLVNKLRAYELQDRGFDTIDANEQLGFDADERVYLPAARMLGLLGFARIRLMTNNPDKVRALQACGVAVEGRVPHAFPANKHNERYLRAKASKGGHLF
ncbi:MAG: GTP cyclohydrolase II [Alphaproteobacteria bacterium]|nr:GTP cyclohydrolase II [Alphaproteobacteria bacterium]MBM3951383.1 GTP cyclohydrolase II [Rhodospirillales bacterium]